MTTTPAPHTRIEPAELTDHELLAAIASPVARCTGADVDPYDWFPVTSDPKKARVQAAHAIALCTVCPVRAECLELSLRHWHGAGRHGVWGGFVEAERGVLRGEWLDGAVVAALVPQAISDHESQQQKRFLRREPPRPERSARHVAHRPTSARARLPHRADHPGAA